MYMQCGLLKLEIYYKYCGKEEEQFLLFSTILFYLLLDFHVRQGPDFHFEISEVEIKRVNCILEVYFEYGSRKSSVVPVTFIRL